MAVWFVMFTQKGIKRISEENRFILAKKIKNIFLEKLSGLKAYNPINQYFLSFGEGAVSNNQEQEFINKLESAPSQLTTKNKIKGEYFLFSDMRETLSKELNTIFTNLDVVQGKNYPGREKNFNNLPDFYIAGVDSGFHEDISLVSFAISMDAFGLGEEKGKQWLDKYVQIENKQERIVMLRELHYLALVKGYFIPLISSSVTAIIRKGWSFDFSKTQVSLPLWKIQKEN